MAKSLVNKVREDRIREGIKRVGKGIQKAVLIASAAASIGVASCRPCINHAPYIEDIPIIYVDEGNEYSQMVEAGDVDGNPISYALTADNELEEGGSSINQTGRITGTAPMVNADTEYAGEVWVSDGIVTEPTSKTFKVQVRNVVEPTPENNSPVADLSVSPTSGVSPLGTEIKVTGTDTDAGDYITNYEAEIDLGQDGIIDETIPAQSTPIDVFRTLNTSAYIYGQVTDSHGTKSPRVRQIVSVSQAPPIPPADDWLDVEGYVKNNKTELAQKGLVKIFDSADEVNPIATVPADSVTGYFKFNSTNKKLSELSGVTLKAVLTDTNGNPISYAHTLRYPAGDLTGVILKPHPNPTFASREDYKRHYRGTNPGIVPELGQKKWDLEGKVAPENALKKIGIFTTNPINSSSFFSQSQHDILISKIKDTDDIEVLVRGSNLPDSNSDGFPDLDSFVLDGEPQAGVHYDIVGSYILPKSGYILVAPDNIPNPFNPGAVGDTSLGYYQGNITTGIISAALIKIKPGISNSLFNTTASHEFKHTFTNPYDLSQPYDSQTLAPNLTILRYDTPNIKVGQGEADIEDAYITNEDTYPFAGSASDFLGDW